METEQHRTEIRRIRFQNWQWSCSCGATSLSFWTRGAAEYDSDEHVRLMS